MPPPSHVEHTHTHSLTRTDEIILHPLITTPHGALSTKNHPKTTPSHTTKNASLFALQFCSSVWLCVGALMIENGVGIVTVCSWDNVQFGWLSTLAPSYHYIDIQCFPIALPHSDCIGFCYMCMSWKCPSSVCVYLFIALPPIHPLPFFSPSMCSMCMVVVCHCY